MSKIIHYRHTPFFLLAGLFFLSACEKVIDIDLADAEPKLIIQASVSSDSDEQFVYISRSVAFSALVNADPVSGAVVNLYGPKPPHHSVITDTNMRYTEIRPGVYRLGDYRGYEGQTYTLHISLDGKDYEASSVMPSLVKIDSIGTIRSSIFGEDRNMVAVKYQDPEGVANYYRYRLIHNGELMNTILVRDDKFNDGRMVEQSLFDTDVDFNVGDHMEVIQQSVTKEVYDFFNAVLSNNPGSAAPANPPSMFGAGTIGYFSAYSADQAATVISN